MYTSISILERIIKLHARTSTQSICMFSTKKKNIPNKRNIFLVFTFNFFNVAVEKDF